jgi:flagellar protein FlbB
VNVSSAFTNFIKIVFLLLLILVVTLGGVFWFDHLGLINYKKLIRPYERFLPSFMRRGESAAEDPLLMERAFIEKREDMLSERERALNLSLQELEARELALKENEAKLREESASIEEEKKVLSEKRREYDNYRENIQRQALYFTGMPPAAAVERLTRLDDLLAIDILRQIDQTAADEGRQSIVPYFLSLMDPERAATLQRKMTKIGNDIQ